jgi:hypothetical protein
VAITGLANLFWLNLDWHHVAMTYGADGVLQFYVNGSSIYNTSVTPASTFPDDVMLVLGQRPYAYLAGWDVTEGNRT